MTRQEALRDIAEGAKRRGNLDVAINYSDFADTLDELIAARAKLEAADALAEAAHEADRFLSHPLDPDDVFCARDELRAALAAWDAAK